MLAVMRVLFAILGAGVIFAYSVLGAVLMTRWELEVASGLPLEDTVAEMIAAGQSYDVAAGVIFGALGGLLAIGWLVGTLGHRFGLSGWFSASLWGGIIAFGAPAYFFASFGNMNSVGDTFYDWNSQAAFEVVSPLYVLSGAGALFAIVALVIGLVQVSAAARKAGRVGDARTRVSATTR